MRKLFGCAIALALVCSRAPAQQMGTVIEARMIMPGMRGEPDTIVSRELSLGMRSRTDFVSASGGGLPGMKLGMSMITNAADTDMVLIYLDNTRKLYAEMHPMSLISTMSDVASFKMRMDSTADSSSVDSIGPGPIIAGHKTIHFRTRSTSKTVLAMMGDSSVRTEVKVNDVFLAPDLRSPETTASTERKTEAVKKMMPAGMDAIMNDAEKTQRRLQPYGPQLKSETEVTSSSAVGTTVHRSSTEALSYRKETIPASVFTVPPAYKKVGVMDLLMPN
jgi:hypothetical protein